MTSLRTEFAPKRVITADVQPNTMPIISEIDLNEPCLGYYEGPLNLAGEWHRYKVVIVIRQDAPAVWYWDMGPALPTDPYPIRIPGYVPLGHGKMEAVETPAQLMYLADQLRTGEVSMDMDQMEPNDVVRLYWEFAEEKKKQPKKQSTFGPGGFTVRD